MWTLALSRALYIPYIVFLVFAVWALVDVIVRPTWAFEESGQSRTLWVIVLVIGAILGGCLGFIAAIIYLVAVRPKVAAAQDARPS